MRRDYCRFSYHLSPTPWHLQFERGCTQPRRTLVDSANTYHLLPSTSRLNADERQTPRSTVDPFGGQTTSTYHLFPQHLPFAVCFVIYGQNTVLGRLLRTLRTSAVRRTAGAIWAVRSVRRACRSHITRSPRPGVRRRRLCPLSTPSPRTSSRILLVFCRAVKSGRFARGHRRSRCAAPPAWFVGPGLRRPGRPVASAQQNLRRHTSAPLGPPPRRANLDPPYGRLRASGYHLLPAVQYCGAAPHLSLSACRFVRIMAF